MSLKYGYENASHQIDYLAAGLCVDGHGYCCARRRVEKLQLLHADLLGVQPPLAGDYRERCLQWVV